MNDNPPLIIHLQWDGPYTWQETWNGKDKLDGPTDYGIYQIYGCHFVYGVDTLLYIGKANQQTFAQRLKQETRWGYHQDPKRVSVYVGRFSGWDGTPSMKSWEGQIDLVEKLLIIAHMPAYNAQKELSAKADKELRNVHVLNWGSYRSLLPEASGLRYTSKFDDETNYKPFTTG